MASIHLMCMLEDLSHPLLLPTHYSDFPPTLMPVTVTEEDEIAVMWFVHSKITLAVIYIFLNFQKSWLWIVLLFGLLLLQELKLSWPVLNSLGFFPAFQRHVLGFPFLAYQNFLHFSQVLRLSVSSLSITDFYPARTIWKHHTYITLLFSRPSLHTFFFAVGFTNICS